MTTTTTPASPAWSPEQVPVTFVADLESARKELACLRTAQSVAIDTETVIDRDAEGNIIPRNLDVEGPGEWRVMSIAARFEEGSTFFPPGTVRVWVLDVALMNTSSLLPLLAGIRPFGWNANFDRFVLSRGGIPVRRWWDAMLGEATLTQGASGGDSVKYSSLAAAARKYLGYEMDGKADTRMSYRSVADEPTLSPEQIQYAGWDALITLEVARVIGAKLREANLVATFVRECDAQPFIESMTRIGLPMNTDGYRGEVDLARAKANAAAERVAIATTGREMLSTLVKWAVRDGRAPQVTEDNLVDTGLELLHTDEVMVAFIAAIKAQLDSCRASLGALTGAGNPVDDLFGEGTFVPLPFDPDNDTETRRWLSKVAPHFVAHLVLSAREDTTLDVATVATAELFAAAGTKRKLTKDHDIEQVLAQMHSSQAPDVTDQLRELALVLLSYRRYARIHAVYGEAAAAGSVLLKPDWNHNSDAQVADMLNRFFPEQVRAYCRENKGEPRLLVKNDSVNKDTLKLMGGELAGALLEFRKWEKIVSTYGDELLAAVHPDTRRIHARYNQCLTGTGRLNSFKPNAQNFSPLAKPYFEPPLVDGKVRRVLVAADLSQAELRFVADQAQDIEMLTAFRGGEDLHERTATLMFGIDMKALKANGDKTVAELATLIPSLAPFAVADPAMAGKALYKLQRTKAKSVAFGYAYGLKGASLANQLTVNGVPTTKEQADELLAKFDVAYPQVAAWMAQRVGFIDNLSTQMRSKNTPSGVDFMASWRLHLVHAKAHAANRKLAKELGRTATPAEVAASMSTTDEVTARLEAQLGHAPSETEMATELERRAATVTWALGYEHAVVLREDGLPWSFESRTAGGRRRLFPVRTGDWVMAIVSQVARSRQAAISAYADAWLQQWNAKVTAEHAAKMAAGKARGDAKTVKLTKADPRTRREVNLDGRELEKLFEDREMRANFVSLVVANMPAAQFEGVARSAMADRIRAMGNQYRNHPIQGGVADAVLIAFARIDEELTARFPTAHGIQSVHDSIVVECDIEDAFEVRDIVVKHMQDALAEFCPNVPCVADGDIQLSLDDKTAQSDEQVNELISSLALAA